MTKTQSWRALDDVFFENRNRESVNAKMLSEAKSKERYVCLNANTGSSAENECLLPSDICHALV